MLAESWDTQAWVRMYIRPGRVDKHKLYSYRRNPLRKGKTASVEDDIWLTSGKSSNKQIQ